MSEMFIEVETHFIADTFEIVVVVDGKERFRGEESKYVEGKGLVNSDVYPFQKGFSAGLTETGINFTHDIRIHSKTEKEFDEKIKNWKRKYSQDG